MGVDSDRIGIRRYGPGDLWLLYRLLGHPAQTVFIGGPESSETIRERHQRYLDSDSSDAGLFTIVVDATRPAGWVGYWRTTWQQSDIWECGWNVLPEFQRRGTAAAGTRLMLADAKANDPSLPMHAFPSVDNIASNALCRRIGFRPLGMVEFEYPKGHLMHCNDWWLDLASWPS